VSERPIEAHGLVKSYPHGVRALDGLSFEVEPGTVFALLGPNGAGKTTAVKILTTLTLPDAGSARVAGTDVAVDPDRVRRLIGVVAQGSGADVQATGRENIRLQGRLYGLDGAPLERRIDELLERFGLSAAANRIVREYSGGMQRRLDVAMALVHDPPVLFLDEPTTGLDPAGRARLWEELSGLSRERGTTTLLTTHYLEEADHLASLVAIVDRGRTVAQGAPDVLKRELRGDAVHVELAAQADGRASEALAEIAEVSDVRVEGSSVLARALDGARAVPAVLSALEARGMDVASVRVARPSLDDVYLRHTGRTFEAAEQEAQVTR
jgi:ABC-2 type transport system ATP-binding protein